MLVANYLQRYCAKNETIGFFGPMGWGRWVGGCPAIAVRPGSHIVRRTSVHFEYWAIDALAQSMWSDPEMWRLTAPCLNPWCRIDGLALVDVRGQTRILPLETAKILAMCDGSMTSAEISEALIADAELGFKTAEQVHAALYKLSGKRLIAFALPVAPDPEKALRRHIAGIADDGAKGRLSGRLDQLELALGKLCGSKGADELSHAFAGLESCFPRITGAKSSRCHGKTYAGRSLAYEDCERDLDLELGPDILNQLGSPLAPILHSLRWLSNAMAESYRRHFLDFYDKSDAAKSRHPLPLGTALYPLQSLLLGMVRDALAQFHRRWAELLRFYPDESNVSFSAGRLLEQVKDAFPSDFPGWPQARFHSPDILIAAESTDDISRGDFISRPAHPAGRIGFLATVRPGHPRKRARSGSDSFRRPDG